MPSAPLAASPQARKQQLTTPASADQKPSKDHRDKENDPRLAAAACDGTPKQAAGVEVSFFDPRFPHTPAARIPIEDLIGNTEDAFNVAPQETTPGDHVFWASNPDSSNPSETRRPSQRTRKRAHSSSPATSQADKSTPVGAAQNDSLNLDTLQKSLRTPKHDPTQDLWNRYTALNASRTNQGEPTLPACLHLLPSSPQTPSTAGKDSALRRAISLGSEWPTSRAKRRKIDTAESHGHTKDIFAASKRDLLRKDLSNNTRVSLLLEKIQESMSRKPNVEQGPSSSSPLPDRRSQALVSPTRPPSRGPPQSAAAILQKQQSSGKSVARGDGLPSTRSFSEFDDDGLDLAEYESVEHALALKVGGEDLGVPQHVSEALPPDGSSKPPSKRKTELEFEDDFDFDNDEDLMNEMLDLAAKYDSQPLKVAADAVDAADPTQREAPKRLESLDEFEDAFDDDSELWENIANHPSANGTTALGSGNQKRMDNRTIKRYLILEVLEGQYEYKAGRTRPEKILSVQDERTTMRCIITLRESWYETRCAKGAYVHVIGKFDRSGACIVNDADNMVIVHPDHLISSTVVGDSFTCMRRAVLQDRVKATSAATQPQVYGHILHEVFGEALRLNKWDADSFRGIIAKILPSYIESLYEIGVRVQDATEYLLGKGPDMMAWASVFVGDAVKANSVIRDRNGALVPTAINRLLELEEHVWSPMYGLKGNIDATVQGQMQVAGEPTKTLVIPLELKTGKRDNVEQHRVQTALYTLLLSDRYDVNVTCGILYYLETSKTFRVEGVRNEIRHMIIERNELACYVHDKLALPPMIKKEHLCSRCYSQPACFIYHKLAEGGDGASSSLGEKFDELVGHLSVAHQEFFNKWDGLLTKEERDSMKFRRELWTMLGSEREGVGRCFSEVMIQPGSARENPQNTKINRYEYTFVKHKARSGFSFTESQITAGDPIIVSDEKGHFNLAAGFVTHVRPTRITLAVDRKLQNARRKLKGFDPVVNQVFSGMAVADPEGASQHIESEVPALYRIDKDEFANGMATARNNIIRIMEKDLWRARELRQLIVELKPPEFKVVSTAYTLSGPASQQNLNIDQQRAIDKVMSARDYSLVLGMPGTGKTTTIAHIIRALVSQNKSVLLASYTHTAVDNILLKIRDDGIPILRIGSVNKVHPEIVKFADISGIPKRTVEELHESWQGSKVVATTCLGVNHGIFNARTFDYCIVDEASQITLPVCLGPIRMARTFILVGDHYQLPPLVQNREAQQGGLDVSLFKLLSDAHPESVVNLEHQYRMADDIMLLSKELVYSGRIKCGNETVANRTLQVPHLDTGLSMHHHPIGSSLPAGSRDICTNSQGCWLRQALVPSSRCLFVNTDTLPQGLGREVQSGARITNPTEAVLVTQLVTTLVHTGVPPSSIGVITFYRSQLAILKASLRTSLGGVAGDVEMHTADKYQGRDKEVVVLSCVRSNEASSVGELLKDWRRVNVAVTRARSKLLILGSKGTLSGSGVEILSGVVRIMDGKGWILDMPPRGIEGHCFNDATQPVTQRSSAAPNAGYVDGMGDEDGMKNKTTADSIQGVKRRAPLTAVLGNSVCTSPVRGTKRVKPTSPVKNRNPPFRMPRQTIRGQNPSHADTFLDKRPVMRDVLNDINGYGVGKENMLPGCLVADSGDNLMDMDVDFDPADFDI